MKLARLRRALRPAVWRGLGAGGVCAALLGTAAAVLALGLTPAWQAQAQALEDAAWQQRHMAARAAARAAARPAALPPLAERLPAAEQARERLARLLELAVRHGVQVQRTEQRLLREADAGALERLQLVTPMVAPYADLRAFIEAALAADDGLSLDHLRLHRPRLDAAELEADLTWSMHQRRSARGAHAS